MSARSWLERLAPHADPALARRLWAEGRRLKCLNYLLVEFQLARGHSWMLGRPYWLTVDPTNFCQLQCPFCPTGAGRGVRDKASLTLEHFRRLLDRVGPVVIHLDLMNWGEPVLNKDLPAMIAYAKRFGIEVKVDANLNDLPAGTAEGLVASGLDVLSVSIDGATQESYETYRVRGRLDRVLENVRRVAEARRAAGSATPRLVWQFLTFRHNEAEIERARRIARELGVDQVSLVAPFMPNEPRVLGAWLAEAPEHRLYAPPAERGGAAPREVVKIEAIAPARSLRARRFRHADLHGWRALRLGPTAWARAWRAWRAGAPRSAASVPFARPGQPVCKWPWAGMTVNPNGSVSPCCSVEDQGDDFGNVLSAGFGPLWNGAMYRRARRHVRRYVSGEAGVRSDSDHVCERCTAIGHANFRFPPRAAAVAAEALAREAA